jgi:charged multivesicular body protein 5
VSNGKIVAELDALQFEEEEEGPSYLTDLNKVPEFVDEAPAELAEVCNYAI